jgi:uncharacterized protein (DUF305 family)
MESGSKRITLAGAVAVLVASVACVKADIGRENPTEQTASATASATTPATGIASDNNADIWFVRHMIPHHQQEIEMSDILLGKRGVDPRVTELAITIKAARSPAIQQMQNWLNQWGSPPVPTMASGGIHTPADGSMLGQLTDRELRALIDVPGADASTLFLTQMIAHHGGAISLAHTEIEEGQHPPAVALARLIADTHQREVDTMKGILSSL